MHTVAHSTSSFLFVRDLSVLFSAFLPCSPQNTHVLLMIAAAAAALAPLCTCTSQTLVWPHLVLWPELTIDASGLSFLLRFAAEWCSIFIPSHPSTQQRFYSFLMAAFMRIWGPRIPHINNTLTECSLIAWSLIIGTSVSCALCYCFHPVRFSHGWGSVEASEKWPCWNM